MAHITIIEGHDGKGVTMLIVEGELNIQGQVPSDDAEYFFSVMRDSIGANYMI